MQKNNNNNKAPEQAGKNRGEYLIWFLDGMELSKHPMEETREADRFDYIKAKPLSIRQCHKQNLKANMLGKNICNTDDGPMINILYM